MLEFKNVCAKYGKNEVLKNITFSLEPHKLTAVIGKNGSGKSTLVSCVNSELNYTGEITCFDRNISLMPLREKAQNIAVLPQFLKSPAITLEELTALGRSPYLDIGKHLGDVDKKLIEMALKQTGVENLRYKMLNNLSGGERQKAYISMVLAQNTRIVILDEPTTYMDMEYESSFFKLLSELKTKHKKTLMVVMHDLTQAVNFADNILLIDDGRIAFYGSAKECVEGDVIEKYFGVQKFFYDDSGKKKVIYRGKQ